MFPPSAVIVAVLITRGRLGTGCCGLSMHVDHSGRGVCCAEEEDRGACAGFQKYSELDIIKAKAFRESGGPMSEIFQKFGIPKRCLCRMIKEDRGVGKWARKVVRARLFISCAKRCRWQQRTRSGLRPSSWPIARTKFRTRCLESLCSKATLRAPHGSRSA